MQKVINSVIYKIDNKEIATFVKDDRAIFIEDTLSPEEFIELAKEAKLFFDIKYDKEHPNWHECPHCRSSTESTVVEQPNTTNIYYKCGAEYIHSDIDNSFTKVEGCHIKVKEVGYCSVCGTFNDENKVCNCANKKLYECYTYEEPEQEDNYQHLHHRCPICSSPACEEQPDASLHCFTIVYECGTEMSGAISCPNEMVFDKRCDYKE